jgi:hypothetical protein
VGYRGVEIWFRLASNGNLGRGNTGQYLFNTDIEYLLIASTRPGDGGRWGRGWHAR